MSRDRLLSLAQAEAAYDILVEEAGANPDTGDRYAFVQYVRTNGQEYRFIGLLGFGGKFRNGTIGGTPDVCCYPEHMNPERKAIIAKVNARLKVMIERTESER